MNLVTSLSGQFLKSQNGGGNHVPERIEEKRVTLATIKPECHLVQVRGEMLGADAMPRSHDAALEKRECGFDRVGCNAESVLVSNVFIGAMIDGFALRYLSLRKAGCVQDGFVGHDYVYIFADVLSHNVANALSCGVFDVNKLQISAPLHDADDDFFGLLCNSAFHAAPLAADVGFINLDCSVQHLADFGHGIADAVTEIPCGLIAAFVLSPDGALELVSTHALLCFAEKQRGEKPFLQGKMRVIEHSAGCNSKLIVAAFAVEELLFRGKFHGGHFAARALSTVRPAEPNKQFAAAFVGVKMLDQVN